MWYIYPVEYYSAIKNNEFMKSLGKWVERHPKWGDSITKEHTWYALIDKRILTQKLGIPKKKFTYQMMPKKKEGEAPSPGKSQCSSVGDYQAREAERGCLENREREEGLWDFQGGEIHERINRLKCK